MSKKLRFAPVIRVSTERQADRGESLNTQRKQIIGFVEQLAGKIPDQCWAYSGREHATVNAERQNLDRLLSDSAKNLFDAVIVCDASRWSRDNLKSKQGLQILRDNGIKFFVGTTEFDLFEPQALLFLGMSTEMNEFFGMEQARKSLINKIALAKKNIPSAGNLPFGRIFDKASGKWGLDPAKHAMIQDAAEKYLAGTHTMVDLAKICNMRTSSLWRIWHTRSGDKWDVRFKSSRLNIDETITYKIPRLLSDKTIAAIKKRAASNRTCTHGYSKNKYLLSRMIFCQNCGRALFGQTQKKTNRYYRRKQKDKGCKFNYIYADQIEADVLLHIFHIMGDKSGFEQAIRDAIPNQKLVEKHERRLQQVIFELKKIENHKQRLVKAVMHATLDDQTVKSEMTKLKDREQLLKDEKSSLLTKLENLPTKKQIDKRFKIWKKMLRDVYTLDHAHLLKMSFEQKRKMLESVFNGKDADGKRLGVYIDYDVNSDDHVTYQIKGILPQVEYGQVGVPPFGFEYEAERQQFENTRNLLVKQICAGKDHRNLYPCDDERYPYRQSLGLSVGIVVNSAHAEGDILWLTIRK